MCAASLWTGITTLTSRALMVTNLVSRRASPDGAEERVTRLSLGP